jgi:hypothetical protein
LRLICAPDAADAAAPEALAAAAAPEEELEAPSLLLLLLFEFELLLLLLLFPAPSLAAPALLPPVVVGDAGCVSEAGESGSVMAISGYKKWYVDIGIK